MSYQDIDLQSESLRLDSLAVEPAPRRAWPAIYRRHGKRVLDILLGLTLLPLLAPVIGALWALTRLDGGAGFFGHERIGRDGRAFRCWKIRTMVVDARERLERHLHENPKAREEWYRDFKLRDDPRITPIGRLLRATSLDELPQIWNVLRGEMSFVGPRPVVQAELARYGVHRATYEAMRPGITGLWQVSGRNSISYDERVQMDLAYHRSKSLLLDLALIGKTAFAVLGRTGH